MFGNLHMSSTNACMTMAIHICYISVSGAADFKRHVDDVETSLARKTEELHQYRHKLEAELSGTLQQAVITLPSAALLHSNRSSSTDLVLKSVQSTILLSWTVSFVSRANLSPGVVCKLFKAGVSDLLPARQLRCASCSNSRHCGGCHA